MISTKVPPTPYVLWIITKEKSKQFRKYLEKLRKISSVQPVVAIPMGRQQKVQEYLLLEITFNLKDVVASQSSVTPLRQSSS